MSTFELDLSKSDSLIDDIQKIFKPPSVEPSGNSRFGKMYLKSLQYSQNSGVNIKDSITYSQQNSLEEIDSKSLKSGNISWKKPKSNSHEYCDSCGTIEGERLVCDRCPASFHLECLDPPIDNEEAPVGVWYCNRCTAIMKEEDDKFSSISAGSTSRIDNDNINIGFTNGCYGLLSLSAKRSVHSSSSASSEITTEMSDEIPMKKRKGNDNGIYNNGNQKLVALQNIQDVVHCLNPKEFDLSKDLFPGIKLPNSFKTFAEMKTKSVVNIENGIIPRPVVTCFECSRTCMYGCLIQCDYCPLYYHLDCLDPPLVQLPSRIERWMCPNHVEQVIDNAGIVKSIRLSERMKAYENLQKEIDNIDEIDLLTSFSQGHGFRFGERSDSETRVKQKIKVPDAVIRMYKYPLKGKKPNVSTHVDESVFTEDQKSLLTSLLQTDAIGTDATTLLKSALDSLRHLISKNNIDLFSHLSPKPLLVSKSGGEKIKSRALLIPISKDGLIRDQKSVARMIYRNCDIGSGLDNDCVISGCKYVSARHASICYLDNHFSFELVNYSRYGTIVDDLLYYNNVSDKDSHKVSQSNQNIKDLRNFLGTNDKSARLSKKVPQKSMKSQRDVDKKIWSCTCSEYGYSNTASNNCQEDGWELTAPLKFGSVIRIGCQSFLFTNVNHSLQPDITESISSQSSKSNSSDCNDNKALNSDTTPSVQTSSGSSKSQTETGKLKSADQTSPPPITAIVSIDDPEKSKTSIEVVSTTTVITTTMAITSLLSSSSSTSLSSSSSSSSVPLVIKQDERETDTKISHE